MQTDLAKEIFERVKGLSDEQQEAVLRFVEGKISFEKRRSEYKKSNPRPIWEIAAEISAEIPIEEWEELPSDGAANHDHYLYGAPKKY